MSSLLSRAGLLAVSVLIGAAGTVDAQVRAAGAGVTPANAKSTGVDSPAPKFAFRLMGEGPVAGGGVAGGDDTGPEPDKHTYIWDNGEQDDIVAYLSTENEHVQSVVADDCWLKEGLFYQADLLVVRVGVTRGFAPNFELRAYLDCDGRPDDSGAPVVYAPADYSFIGPGTGDMAALDLYEVEYDINEFGPGEQLGWLSVVHIDTVDFFPEDGVDVGGFGYWLSAGKGTVQGRQSHVKSPALLGSPDFVPADTEICCGVCTDMYMKLLGKCCWRVLDQDDPDYSATGGLYDPVLSQNAPWVRSYDDFQLADPCNDATTEYGICRIEAYVATNCDVETIYAEIIHNLCDMPSERLTSEPTANGNVRFAPTSHEQVDTIDGLPVYKFVFECPEDVYLFDGENYWLTVFSEQGFGAGKRTVWLFENREVCNIRINEAKYWNPTIGYDMPTGVSDVSLAGAPRGHAFSVWVCERPLVP